MSRRPQAPGVIYAVIALTLVVLIGLLALSSRQPPPPTIAEFAPQSVENITDAPNDQSSSSGSGAGDCAAGQACGAGGGVTPSPEASTTTVARVRKCVGDPPRQIEDPQSPPCVPSWTGDNGGATSRGVTRDEVIIANAGGRNTGTPQTDFQNFFNKRFEFYGRKIRIVATNTACNGAGTCDTQQEQNAAAVAVEQQVRAFASTEWDFEGNTYYGQELARRHVLFSPAPEFNWPRRALEDMAPYVWQYPMAPEDMFSNIGEWMCKRFAGGTADHAGGSEARRPRVFGVLLRPAENDPPVSLATLRQAFAACGGTFSVSREYPQYGASHRDTTGDFQSATNTVQQFHAAGVTTILCLCAYYQYPKDVWQAASGQGYYPEWLVSSFGAHGTTWSFNWIAAVPDQAAHAMGIAFEPKELPVDSHPFVWARKEVNAAYDTGSEINEHRLGTFYRSLLVLASGIQMAGPHLTPETFAQGLHRAVFPNPEHPNMAGKVGFSPNSYSMTLDGAEFWFSNTDTPAWPNPHDAGSVCYINNGARHRVGEWPSGPDPFFQPPCR